MYLYSVGMAVSNLCTYHRMKEGPIVISGLETGQKRMQKKDDRILNWVFVNLLTASGRKIDIELIYDS